MPNHRRHRIRGPTDLEIFINGNATGLLSPYHHENALFRNCRTSSEEKRYHLCHQHVRLVVKVCRNMRVVGAASFLPDFGSFPEEGARLFTLSLCTRCHQDEKCGGYTCGQVSLSGLAQIPFLDALRY